MDDMNEIQRTLGQLLAKVEGLYAIHASEKAERDQLDIRVTSLEAHRTRSTAYIAGVTGTVVTLGGLVAWMISLVK